MKCCLAALLCLLSLGCEACDREDSPEEQAARRPALEADPSTAEGALPEEGPWPEDIEALPESLERNETPDECAARLRQRVPVEVSEVMADIGYDRVIQDVCTGMAAIRAGSIEPCESLSASSIRDGCMRRVAIVAANPSFCPEARVTEGKDPLCLAWASRDESLCAGVTSGDRTRCKAVLSGDTDDCISLSGRHRVQCEAEVRRYGPALGEERPEPTGSDVDPFLRITATPIENGGADGESSELGFEALDRGVYIEAHTCRHRIAVESQRRMGERAPEFGLRFSVVPGAEAPVEVPLGLGQAELTLSIPGVGTADSAAGARGSLTLTHWSVTRGELVSGQLRGNLDLGAKRLKIEGRFRTFVRDVQPLPESCSPRAP